MATRCSILIKLKDEDLDKKLCINKNLYKYDISKIKDIKCIYTDKYYPYIGIYIMYDGYLSYTGNVLNELYNTYEKAKNLILMGYMDIVPKKIISNITKNLWCIRYGWEYESEPRQFTKIEPVGGDSDYIYVFEDNKWIFFKNMGTLKDPFIFDFNKPINLSEYLKNEKY